MPTWTRRSRRSRRCAQTQSEAAAARHNAAAYSELQRLHGADPAVGLRGKGLSEQQLFDYRLELHRTQLVTVPGAAIPYPYGGKQRQIMVDLDTHALQAKGLSRATMWSTRSATRT